MFSADCQLYRISKANKLAIFKAFIMAPCNYCPVVWHSCSASNTATLERIQTPFCVQRLLQHLRCTPCESRLVHVDDVKVAFIGPGGLTKP